uniref:SFRICE_040271 n=1 Tax=Spodoptera frugiperda TaxID=7108 RepID=A0A2H1V5Y5_SPOFR
MAMARWCGGRELGAERCTADRGRREVQTVGTARPFNSEPKRGRGGDFCTDVIMKWNDVTDISELFEL